MTLQVVLLRLLLSACQLSICGSGGSGMLIVAAQVEHAHLRRQLLGCSQQVLQGRRIPIRGGADTLLLLLLLKMRVGLY